MSWRRDKKRKMTVVFGDGRDDEEDENGVGSEQSRRGFL